jgi:ubiquinone/menaquinone biosynthesis C-methylase UbiE
LTSYEDSLALEQEIYANCTDVHHLPPIFHYWSNRYLVPKLEPHGFTNPFEFFLRRTGPRPVRLASLGAGNGDLEITLAQALPGDVQIDCLDVNATMLARASEAAQAAGVSSKLSFLQSDLNHWTANKEYDAVIANQSLHHVLNLEGLFQEVKRSLRPGGQFLISDMIGRNGHQRWPEALDVIHEFWRKLPPSYRFNQIVGYFEELYQSWDCSTQGFEGVRAQDILPLLLDRFHFSLFVGYGNVIDPFIDRAFGPHFDPAREWDRQFIDEVHRRDEEELASGRLKPTHMMAVVTNAPTVPFSGNLAPQSCVRQPSPQKHCLANLPAYEWDAWPHKPQQELEIACRRLADTGREIKQRTEWALNLKQQLDERTAWALSLEKDVQERTAWALHSEKELEVRTAWTLGMQSDVEKRTAWALDLQQQVEALEQDVEDKTIWALRLKQELAEQTERAQRAEAELHKLTHHPLYLLKRILKRAWNTVR